MKLNKLMLSAKFVEARELKSEVNNLYSDAMELTFPTSNTFYDISNSSVNSKSSSDTIFNDITTEVAETLANQMELSLTRNGDQWAGFALKDALNNVKEAVELREKNKEIFDYIHDSNFQKQISPVYRDLLIGTGVLKISIVNKELVFKHLNIGRCYLLENGKGDVDTVFYKLKKTTITKVEEMLKDKIVIKNREHYYNDDGTEIEFNIYEGVVPFKNKKGKKGFQFFICSEDFQDIFYEKFMNTNPYIVARFNKRNDIGVWGVGKVIERLPLLRTIQYFSKKYMETVYRDSNPAYMVTTPNQKQPQTFFEPGAYYFFPVGTQVTPLFSNIDLQKLQGYIMELEAKLKQAFLIDSILEAQATNTYKTATEIQIANTKFLDKFATYASAISDELPKQIFLRTYELLKDNKIIKKIPKDLMTEIVYNNPIIVGEKQKEVDKLVQIAQTVIGLVGQENFIAELKVQNVPTWIVDKMGGDFSLFNTDQEAEAMRGQMIDAQAQQQGVSMDSMYGPGAGQMAAEEIGGAVGYEQ